MKKHSLIEKMYLLVDLIENAPVAQHGLISTLAKEIRDDYRLEISESIDGDSETTVKIFPDKDVYERQFKAYTDFDEYVFNYPEAEIFRNWMRTSKDKIVIFESPVTAFSGALPGGFYWACIVEMRDGTFRVIIQGCDDGMLVKDLNAMGSAISELNAIYNENISSFVWFKIRGYKYE